MLRFARRLRFSAGADDTKPRWSLPAKDYLKYSYQPSMPDKHFFGAHWNYAPLTMWFRARRPTMEKIGTAMFDSAKNGFNTVLGRPMKFADSQLPGFLHKIAAAFAAWFAFSYAVRSTYGDETDAWMTLEKLHNYGQALKLEKQGFWLSKEEDTEMRSRLANDAAVRGKEAFTAALKTATESRNFQVFSDGISSGVDLTSPIAAEEERILMSGGTSWRFSLMPYGAMNEDTKTFPVPETEQRTDAYQFMDAGDYGDYIDRKDNKPEPIRKSRQLFASAYIPPTK